MLKYYASFGLGHENEGKVQPIFAENDIEARMKMIKKHGDKWAFLYSKEQFEQSKKEGFFKNVVELKAI